MNFKETFLKLTEYTVPFKYESTLEPLLPRGYKRDKIGNYYYEIGNSETLFTTHLDTYSDKRVKINHIIEGDIIKTDGKSILGGDNKLGCCILFYMMENNIPGTYYFFLGEEPILSGGLWGSQNALDADPEFFKKFKRAIAFDRKMMGSVVTRQMARQCCSDEFADMLCSELSMDYKKDSNAYYTDTATFMDVIPECTNISAGGYNEHYFNEYVDIAYTEKVAKAACKVNWESLPVSRKLFSGDLTKVRKYKDINLIKDINGVLSKYDKLHTNKLEYESGNTDKLVFNDWFKDTNVSIEVLDGIILLEIDNVEIARVKTVLELDKELSYIYGVQFDIDANEKKLGLEFFKDGIQIGDSGYYWKDYLKWFKSYNSDNTSYISDKSKDQFFDSSGVKLDKIQFLSVLKDYMGIEV